MEYYSDLYRGTGFDPKQSIIGWGSGEMQNSAVQQVQQATQIFQQQFANLVGRPPSQQELGMFQSQALTSAINNPGDLGYGDASNLSNNFIQQAFTPEMQAHAQQVQTDQLGKSQNMVQDLINKTMGNTAGQFADPSSRLYQSFSGQMNNLGITPSSGAFQAGAGSTIADSGMNAANNALQQIGIPGIRGIQGLSVNPNISGNNDLSHIGGMSDFGLQADLARQLAEIASPSRAQTALQMAGGAAGAAGGLMQGAGALKSSGATWICTALRKEGLLSYSEVALLHDHLYKAVWKRPFKFLGYILFGKLLVRLAYKYDTDWRIWKSEFYDNIIDERDPAKALDLYEAAFWKLYLSVTARKYNRDHYREGLA